MADPRKAVVAAGYESLGEQYSEWAARIVGDPRDRMLADFIRRLPVGSRVLDLGCGSGIPSTRELARVFQVLGVDISRAQVRAARRNVPQASFVQGDFVELRFPAATFNGVTAFYAISHVPREEHAELFSRIAHWLTPGGLLLATLGASDNPDWTGRWLGVPMFFSSYDPATNRRMLQAAGFQLLADEVVEMQEPEGPAAFQWVLALRLRRTPGDSTSRDPR